MKKLLKHAGVVNVFTETLEKKDILLQDDKILLVEDHLEEEADEILDLEGRWVLPGFIDGHIHIESTMLTPYELARAVLPHGTTMLVADPHEIANVKGCAGLEYMLESSEGLPVDMYFMLPSCVPAAPQEEAGAVLEADDLAAFYAHPRVLGLGEVMSYPAVLAGDEKILAKIEDAGKRNRIINGHAPLLSGKDLDRYIAAGITDDHECSSFAEARERIEKGQHIMIRQGTAAKNLPALVGLLQKPWADACMFCVDDLHAGDLYEKGHIDYILKKAVELGADPVQAVKASSWNAARYYGFSDRGAVAPGYRADLVVVSNLRDFQVEKVFKNGQLKVTEPAALIPFDSPSVSDTLRESVRSSFGLRYVRPEDFHLPYQGKQTVRVIEIEPGSLISRNLTAETDFSSDNGVDLEQDLIKIAVLERHQGNGHIGLGLLKGSGLKKGAVASSICHDAHNLVVLGVSEEEMARAAGAVIQNRGGQAVVSGDRVLAQLPLHIGGIISDTCLEETAEQNKRISQAARQLGACQPDELLMSLAFMALPVIPELKLTTTGYYDVVHQKHVDLIHS